MEVNNEVNPGSLRRHLILGAHFHHTRCEGPHTANQLPKLVTFFKFCGDESGATRSLGHVGANEISGDLTAF